MSAEPKDINKLITDNLDIWTSAIKSKSRTGRGANKTYELYGIKKLRELILDLAVRGLLVPQDPNDEPASELLQKIAAEKEKLIKEGKIKKQKPLSSITKEEKSFGIPLSWEWVKLGEITDFVNGFAFKSNDFINKGVGIVKIGDIQNNEISTKSMSRVNRNIVSKLDSRLSVKQGDMLIAMSGATTGKLGFNKTSEILYINQRVGKIKPILISNQFIFFPLTTKISENLSKSLGSAIPNLSTNQINNIVIALPPLNEQNRIVAKVDELMALCDQLEQQTETSIEAHKLLVENLLAALTQAKDHKTFQQAWQRIAENFDTLFTTEHSIDQLKQTILQLAVMGKLVPQDPNDEPASELLKKIAAEKEQLIKQGKIKKQKPLPEITEEEKPFELPEGWEWVSLSNLISVMDAGWSPACPPEPSSSVNIWGVLKTTAVQSMEYWEHENKVLSEAKEPKPQYEVNVGDILITRAGPKNRVGVSCLVDKTRPKLMISDKIIRFHLVEIGLIERYISLCLNAGATANYIENAKSGMAESQMNISQIKLKKAPIPLCPINEQRRIVLKVDELINLCGKLRSQIADSNNTQSIIADLLTELNSSRYS